MSDYIYELPEEKDFLATLIDYVKHNKQIGLEAILKNCNMTFKSTSTFTEKIWDTY